MRYEALNVDVDYTLAGVPGTGRPTLYAYLRDASPEMTVPARPALIICPGGGYECTSFPYCRPDPF